MTAHQDAQDAILGLIDAGVGSAPTVDAAVGLHADCRACGTFVEPPDVAALRARVALLEGLLRDVHADLYDTMSPRLNRRIVAALADGG